MFLDFFKEMTEVSDQRKTEIFDKLFESIDKNQVLVKMQFNNFLNNLLPPEVVEEEVCPPKEEVLDGIPEDKELPAPKREMVSYTDERLVLGFLAAHALEVIETVLTPEEGPGTPAQELYWGTVRLLARLYHLQTRVIES